MWQLHCQLSQGKICQQQHLIQSAAQGSNISSGCMSSVDKYQLPQNQVSKINFKYQRAQFRQPPSAKKKNHAKVVPFSPLLV